VRSFKPEVQQIAEATIRRIAAGTAAAFGIEAEVAYTRGYPATVNAQAECDIAARVAALVVGEENVETAPAPKMGAEDFAYLLNRRPGCYIWVGNGPGEGGCWLHNAQYDFNDDALPIGASYWARLAETQLAKR